MWEFFFEELDDRFFSEEGFSDLYSNIGLPFQISFQEPASPVMNGLLNLHDYVFFFILIILMIVLALLIQIVSIFSLSNNNKQTFSFYQIEPRYFEFNVLIRFYTFLNYLILIIKSFFFFVLFILRVIFLFFTLKLNVKKWFKKPSIKKDNVKLRDDSEYKILKNFKVNLKKNYIFKKTTSSYSVKDSSFFNALDISIKLMKEKSLEKAIPSLLSESFSLFKDEYRLIEACDNYTLFAMYGMENRILVSLDDFFLIFPEYANYLYNIKNENVAQSFQLSLGNNDSKSLFSKVSFQTILRNFAKSDIKNTFTEEERKAVSKCFRESNYSLKRRVPLFLKILTMFFSDFMIIRKLCSQGFDQAMLSLMSAIKAAGKTPFYYHGTKIVRPQWGNPDIYTIFPDYVNNEGEVNNLVLGLDDDYNILSNWVSEEILNENVVYDFNGFITNQDILFFISRDENEINSVLDENLGINNNISYDLIDFENLLDTKEEEEGTFSENEELWEEESLYEIIINNIFFNLFVLKDFQYFKFYSSLWKNILFAKIKLNPGSFATDFFDEEEIDLGEKNDLTNIFNKKHKRMSLLDSEVLEQMVFFHNFYLNSIFSYVSVNLQRAIKINYFNHSTRLEIIWTVIPIIIIAFIITPSFFFMYAIDEDMESLLTIRVLGHQWYRSYVYALPSYMVNFNDFSNLSLDNNLVSLDKKYFAFDSYMNDNMNDGSPRLLSTDNILILPKYFHINCVVTSSDVLHSWALPSLGVKIDAVPGRLNRTDVFLEHEGMFFGQCSELCGVNHSFMPIQLESVSLTSFLRFISNLDI